MALKKNIFGQRYDTAVPAFLFTDSPNYVVDRLSGKMIGWSSLAKLAAEKGYRFTRDEVGAAPQSFTDSHPMQFDAAHVVDPTGGSIAGGGSTGVPQQPMPINVHVNITGYGTPNMALEFAGGPAGANGAVSITGMTVDGTDIQIPSSIAFAAGDSLDVIAGKVATALDGAQDAGATITLSASANGGRVSLTQSGSSGAGNFDHTPRASIS